MGIWFREDWRPGDCSGPCKPVQAGCEDWWVRQSRSAKGRPLAVLTLEKSRETKPPTRMPMKMARGVGMRFTAATTAPASVVRSRMAWRLRGHVEGGRERQSLWRAVPEKEIQRTFFLARAISLESSSQPATMAAFNDLWPGNVKKMWQGCI